MNVKDLDKDQLIELKQAFLVQTMDREGKCPSYGELADVDELISDEQIYEAYSGIEFSAGDFICTAEKELEEEVR